MSSSHDDSGSRANTLRHGGASSRFLFCLVGLNVVGPIPYPQFDLGLVQPIACRKLSSPDGHFGWPMCGECHATAQHLHDISIRKLPAVTSRQSGEVGWRTVGRRKRAASLQIIAVATRRKGTSRRLMCNSASGLDQHSHSRDVTVAHCSVEEIREDCGSRQMLDLV